MNSDKINAKSIEIFSVLGMFLFCLVLGRFGVWGQTGELGVFLSITLGIVFLIPLVFYIWQSARIKDWKKYLYLCSVSLISFFSVIGIQWIHFIQVNNGDEINILQEYWVIGTTILVLIIGCSFTFFIGNKSVNYSRFSYYFAFATSIALRFMHVTSVRYHIFQNDLGHFADDGYGHLGYIHLLYKGANILKINPLGHDQLYHPPLYHFLAAVYLRFQNLIGYRLSDMAPDVIQTFSLFISFLTTLYLMKIMRKLGADDWGCILGLGCLTVIHYINQSAGTLNNDGLLVLLCIMSIYYCLVWMNNRDWKGIILCGLTIGLAMMTKLSAVALAIPMAVAFLIVLFKDRKKRKKDIMQYLCFGIVSLPLGLWHPLYFLFKFNKPLNYCPRTTISSMMIYYGKWDYLFNFDGCFDSINPNLTSEISTYVEHNIPVSILKHAVVGEGFVYDLTWINERFAYFNYNIMWILAVMMVIAGICFIVSKKQSLEVKILIMGTILSFLAFLVKFAWEYPYTCTIHIRYVLTSVMLGVGIVGLLFSDGKKWQQMVIKILFMVFCISGYAWSICVMMSL